MTQSCRSYFVLLVITFLLLANCYIPDKTLQELQCKKSKSNEQQNAFIFSCGTNSTILVKIIAYAEFEIFHLGYIQLNCYKTTHLKISLPLNMHFTSSEYDTTVEFNSCQFNSEVDILKILTISLQLSNVGEIVFDNELIDSSLSRAHLNPLDGFVKKLKFKIKNLSSLPMDLFEDLKTLESLSIYSNSTNSTHLSRILAPLENLNEMVLETNNLQDISRSIFAENKNLYSLSLRNITTLPTGFLSNLSNLKNIYLNGNYFRSLPEDLFQNTKNLEEFSLVENRVALQDFPDGLLRNLPLLKAVRIVDCGLESIDSDIFSDSTFLGSIVITGNNLHELPLTLFANQDDLYVLDLSRNMLKTLPEGLFDFAKNLQRLDLSDNNLTNLSKNIFQPLARLETLNLENNDLLTISMDSNQPQLGSIFDNAKHLEELNLKSNSISEIPYNIFKEIPALEILDLSLNKINSINCNFVTFYDSKINIFGNPIHCDGNVICLHQHIIQKAMEAYSGLRQIRCESPSAFKGLLLYDLSPRKLLSFPNIMHANFSNRCSYKIRLPDSVLVMNCSDESLNDIPTLPILERSFSKGIELYMDKNPLTELSNKILKDNPNVTLFSLFDSTITQIPKGFLFNMNNLKTVSLVMPLNDIPNDVFFNSNAIETLNISGTNIESLPESIFVDLFNIVDLDLSWNRLKTINPHQFKSNINLETIRLSHNFLEELSGLVVRKLAKLKKLFLDNNRLIFVDIIFESKTPRLEFLNMENNELINIDISSATNLKTLLLRNNKFEYFNSMFSMLKPEYVDLSLNNLNYIDLSNSGFINLNTTIWNFTENDIQTIEVSYEDTYLRCDCKTATFVTDNKLSGRRIFESLKCLSPNNLSRVSYVPLEELLCPIPIASICPEKCQCWIRPAKPTLIVNCSNASLTEVPSLAKLERPFEIELSIEHNKLRSLKPYSSSDLNSVIRIIAAHNKITHISSEDIPKNLVVLDVSYNKLERLDKEVIKVINESRTLTSVNLHHNAFKCDCSSESVTRFITLNKKMFLNFDECADGQKFSELVYHKICESHLDRWIGIILLIILGALLLLTILYFKNKDCVLIWLYAHNIFLCWVTEEELDREKRFDAFISYSSWDMDFVGINLIPKLESGPRPYKLCLHDRDWLAGGFIPHQIEQSVECSRRTIIVMSQNYIKSQWTRLEFRTAHIASMNEKRPRVVVIMLDENIQLESLDADLRKYIKMYTYIKWNDPWFWDKLRYALPHPSKKKQKIEQYQMNVIHNGNADGRRGDLNDQNDLI